MGHTGEYDTEKKALTAVAVEWRPLRKEKYKVDLLHL